jgi:hypothetical protein
MSFSRITRVFSLLLWIAAALANPPSPAAKRPFTVADDITLVHFGDPYTADADPVTFSPDGRYFVVDTERGLLDRNRSESTLRLFRTEDVHHFVLHPRITDMPTPIWILSKSTYKDAPIISNIRWLMDSSGFGFLVKTGSGNKRLFIANLKTKTLYPLTPTNQNVTAFGIRDRNNFVYSVLSPEILRKADEESRAPAIIGTGRSLLDLMFPPNSYPSLMSELNDVSDLWTVMDGKRFRVTEKSSGQPFHLYTEGQNALALSPNLSSVVTALPLRNIPREWESLYPPPEPSSQYRIRAGSQDVGMLGEGSVSEFVLIDLFTGEAKPLTRAPIGDGAGWWQEARAAWSADGREVVLSNTFLPPDVHNSHGQLNRPCVAVVNLVSGSAVCLETMRALTTKGFEEGYRLIEKIRFVSRDNGRVAVNYQVPGGSRGTTNYVRLDDGSWGLNAPSDDLRPQDYPLAVSVNQGFKDPPVLVATDNGTRTSRVILDPNPQLKDIDFGEVSILQWKDGNGRQWSGGLFKPPDYIPGKRYPLVVQTHDFFESEFEPSGVYPTAFAARELAGAGILVLQVNQCTIMSTPEEAPCNVAMYESGVEQLVTDGLVDPNRIGIIGFSRTCYHVLEALTTSKLHFKAASITDGVNFGYFEYITNVDSFHDVVTLDANGVIGVPPFREGLRRWLEQSPDFNMNKVTTPLQVVANGRLTLMEMWEPYAALRLLRKPVDLILLPGGTHILTNPGERMASQGGTVDWMRFWLQGYEDPDPAKSDRYGRWRQMYNEVQNHK